LIKSSDQQKAGNMSDHPMAKPWSEWQPIETAPKDGSWVLLSGGEIEYRWDGDSQPPAVVAQWSTTLNLETVAGHWQFAWYDGGYYGEYVNPTHWMSLPPPKT
jgi:hypothetical protein